MNKKTIFYLVSTIVLGALGSGLWENIFSPLFSIIVSRIISFLNIVFKIQSDSTYIEIATLRI